MNYDTPQSNERQPSILKRENVPAALAAFAMLCIMLCVIAYISMTHPQAPQQPFQFQPEPPRIDNSVHVEILSNNQFFSNNQTCIGSCGSYDPGR